METNQLTPGLNPIAEGDTDTNEQKQKIMLLLLILHQWSTISLLMPHTGFQVLSSDMYLKFLL